MTRVVTYDEAGGGWWTITDKDTKTVVSVSRTRPHAADVEGHGPIRAVPQWYRGVRFRSTLEADWAYNFDQLEIVWEYEPEAVRFSPWWSRGPQDDDVFYLPDFYLPEIRTYFEVKGNHDERLNKTNEFAAAADAEHVVIGRPAVRGKASFDIIVGQCRISQIPGWESVLARCDVCGRLQFCPWMWEKTRDKLWLCRADRAHGLCGWTAPSGEPEWQRAPRETAGSGRR